MSDSDCFALARVVPQAQPCPAERLWRVRKDSRTMDAVLRVHPDGLDGGVEIQFFYKGDFICRRRCTTRAEAIAEADTKLHELLRLGWATHW